MQLSEVSIFETPALGVIHFPFLSLYSPFYLVNTALLLQLVHYLSCVILLEASFWVFFFPSRSFSASASPLLVPMDHCSLLSINNSHFPPFLLRQTPACRNLLILFSFINNPLTFSVKMAYLRNKYLHAKMFLSWKIWPYFTKLHI